MPSNEAYNLFFTVFPKFSLINNYIINKKIDNYLIDFILKD